jgi:DNA-binding transcriptional LysR family regulator
VPIILGKMLPPLREKQPSLKLDISGDLRKVDLLKGEADIAVRMIRPSETDLVARRCFDCGWFVYTSVTYSGTRGTPASLDELKDHHLVLYDESMHNVEPLRSLEAYRGKDFVRVDNLEIASQLVAAGTGIGVLPAFFTQNVTGLLRVFPQAIASNIGWVVYHESAREKARVRCGVDALVEFFESNAAVFTGLTE